MNTTITPTWVSKDTAMFWQNSIRLIGQADRGYGKEWIVIHALWAIAIIYMWIEGS